MYALRSNFAIRATALFGVFLGFSATSPQARADFFGVYPSQSNTVARAWQGFYVGAHAGYNWSSYEANVAPGPGAFDIDDSGFTFGGYGGYNAQFQQFVAGVEGDITFGLPDASRSVAGTVYAADSSWQTTLRGRFGYTYEQFLLYGTGGFALGTVEYSSPLLGSADSVKFGGVLGAGVEAQVTGNITARAEYLYTTFGSGTYALGPLTTTTGDASSHALRIGIGYQF